MKTSLLSQSIDRSRGHRSSSSLTKHTIWAEKSLEKNVRVIPRPPPRTCSCWGSTDPHDCPSPLGMRCSEYQYLFTKVDLRKD